MYYCENCREEFDEPRIEKTTYEDFYEIGAEFPNKTEMNLEKCPYCGSDEFEEMTKCEQCGEYCRECDLLDTEELNGGGVGVLCPDCYRDNGFGGGD